MYTFVIELVSLIMFIGCFWHAARFENRAFAQQWFVGGVLFVFTRETIVQLVLQTYVFAPAFLRVGVVPLFIVLLYPSVIYLSFHFARVLYARESRAIIAGLVFLIAASIALPIEATAALSQWWIYREPLRALFGAPMIAPLVWGGAAVIFYAIFSKVRDTRLPDRGKFYAMIVLASVIAATHLLWTLILGIVG